LAYRSQNGTKPIIKGESVMSFSLKTASARITLTLILLSFATGASAGPKEDVAAAASTWAGALGEDEPDKVLQLYSDDAVLWGTLSPTVRADRSALRDYFVTAFRVLPGLKVTFGDQLIRVYGTTAVNTGYYTFTYVKDGETKVFPMLGSERRSARRCRGRSRPPSGCPSRRFAQTLPSPRTCP